MTGQMFLQIEMSVGLKEAWKLAGSENHKAQVASHTSGRYSERSATIGSTFVARRAGMKAAARAINANKVAAAT